MTSDGPARVGDYHILQRLGAGGMATVYLAEKTGRHGFAKRVALKLMQGHLIESEEHRALFLDEARLAARLNHPNIAQVFDFGQDGDNYFIAMELVEGISLAALRRNPIPLPALVRIIVDAARGLEHAHFLCDELGRPLRVVHRDVSPQNLMITRAGLVKVLDFGVALSRERSTVTETGLVRGKPAFMAPEQVTGGAVDARADVFALGIMLHEGLTGVPLFRRDNMYATVRAVMEAPVADPRDVDPSLPDGLVDIVRRALMRDLDLRLGSARELADGLAPFAGSHEDVAAAVEVAMARGPAPGSSLEGASTSVVGTDPSRAPGARSAASGGNAGEYDPAVTKNARARHGRASTEEADDTVAVDDASGEPHDGATPDARAPTPPRSPRMLAALGAVAALAGATAGAWLLRPAPDAAVILEGAPSPSPADAGAALAPPLSAATPATFAPSAASGSDGGSATSAPPRALASSGGRRSSRRPAPKPPEEKATVPSEPGTIQVTSREWRKVRIDGALRGDTPLTVRVPAGHHTVELLEPRTEQVLRTDVVTIAAGATTSIRAKE